MFASFPQEDYFCLPLEISQNESALIKHCIFTISGPISNWDWLQSSDSLFGFTLAWMRSGGRFPTIKKLKKQSLTPPQSSDPRSDCLWSFLFSCWKKKLPLACRRGDNLFPSVFCKLVQAREPEIVTRKHLRYNGIYNCSHDHTAMWSGQVTLCYTHVCVWRRKSISHSVNSYR